MVLIIVALAQLHLFRCFKHITIFSCKHQVQSHLTFVQVVMGLGSKFFDPGRVRHLWFGFEFEKLSLKMSNFSIFALRVKKNLFGSESTWVGGGLASYLLRVKSKLGSGGLSRVSNLSLEKNFP